MATFKTDEQLKKYLTKRVQYDVQKERWGFNGIKFRMATSYFEGAFFSYVTYTCDLNELNVNIERWAGRNREILAEKSFSGSNVISECIAWVVDRLMEVYKLLNERVAPYQFNKEMYERQLNRPLNLQEGG